MTPESVFCPNYECPARGQCGRGNIGVHSAVEQRYMCHECGLSFSATKGSLFYRLRTPPETVMRVIVLLAFGCPLQAIVQAFGFDERTVKSWWQRAGVHSQGVHAHLVEEKQFDLQQVQADEIKVKQQGGTLWMALALMVPSRLWLGGVLSPQRDKALIAQLMDTVRGMALCRPLLIAVDGLSSYVSVTRAAFRSKVPRCGALGRCRLRAWDELAMVQVIKGRASALIERRLVQGEASLVARLIHSSQGAGGINTAFIERLNATFRSRLCWLTRRTRGLARQQQTL